jgi:two-component system KDP operon response regulator KdpE
VEIHLTPTEFRLLQTLAEQPDRVVSHRELLEAVWGAGYEAETHLLQVTIRNLRAKLAVVVPDSIIGTVYGLGYRIVEI